MSLVIRANYLADQTQNCNSAILYISSTNPKFLERLKRFDLARNPQFEHRQNIEDLLKLYAIGRFVNYRKKRAVLICFPFRNVAEGTSPNFFL